jgi:propionyl-CoA carboxylase alpha chain
MNIRSVAVYSDADTNTLHVAHADEAVYIGPSPADQSYLSIDKIMDAVRNSGAEAVHPGYGFLSENPKFADALKKEGVELIGPSSEAMIAMGDKIESKRIATKAKVNTIPGYDGEVKNYKEAAKIAGKIGYPVMVKASAGGGGKGMRIVHAKEEMQQAFSSAVNEAVKSFGDDRIFIEKFIEDPRHIEIQILADKHGNIICLGERECSIQRHRQKVIEEAPSVLLDNKTREKMYEQSRRLAKKVGYYSAGTVEYIVDQNRNFYFLEMNTRLQVEHPVTEMITGIDLVEQMIRVANGERLEITQDDVNLKGWSIESRIYAEDPTRGFLPSVGRITEYKIPTNGGHIRVDDGVYAGGEVSMFYDPMIAKLITYGKTRTEAIKYMQQALGEYYIAGISHNISFLEAVMSHPRFASGEISTNFIEEEYPDGFSGADLNEETTKVLLAVGLYIYLRDVNRATTISGQVAGRERQIGTRWVVTVDDQSFSVYNRNRKNGYEIRYENYLFNISSNWTLGDKLFLGTIDGKDISVKIDHIPGGYMLTHAGATTKVTVRSPRVAELDKFMPESQDEVEENVLLAPISGKVVEVKVKEGVVVTAGQDLIILEAMKMENVLYSEKDYLIKKINFAAGDNVQVDQVLIEFEEEKDGDKA